MPTALYPLWIVPAVPEMREQCSAVAGTGSVVRHAHPVAPPDVPVRGAGKVSADPGDIDVVGRHEEGGSQQVQ